MNGIYKMRVTKTQQPISNYIAHFVTVESNIISSYCGKKMFACPTYI